MKHVTRFGRVRGPMVRDVNQSTFQFPLFESKSVCIDQKTFIKAVVYSQLVTNRRDETRGTADAFFVSFASF